MLKIVLFCSTLVVVFGYNDKIIGGTSTTIKKYPYTVSVRKSGEHHCGGSIINEKTIVTAAHCTKSIPLKNLSIRAGSTMRNFGGVEIKIKNKIEHPDYNRSTKEYDISILELVYPLIFSESILPIELLTDEPNVGNEGICTGWGGLNKNRDLANILQEVTLPIIDRHKCGVDYPGLTITENMICAGYFEGGKDACHGDSGGPLAIDGKLAGVVAFGCICAWENCPGVYTNVATLNSFILENSRFQCDSRQFFNITFF